MKASVAVVTAEENVASEDVAVARGVTYRVVLERSAFEQPGFIDRVVESIKAGERCG